MKFNAKARRRKELSCRECWLDIDRTTEVTKFLSNHYGFPYFPSRLCAFALILFRFPQFNRRVYSLR